jgi:hypothetical protein
MRIDGESDVSTADRDLKSAFLPLHAPPPQIAGSVKARAACQFSSTDWGIFAADLLQMQREMRWKIVGCHFGGNVPSGKARDASRGFCRKVHSRASD